LVIGYEKNRDAIGVLFSITDDRCSDLRWLDLFGFNRQG